MKLIVKLIDAPSVAGGKAYVLCTEDGEMLPMQTGCIIENNCDSTPTITCSFAVDGEKVSLG